MHPQRPVFLLLLFLLIRPLLLMVLLLLEVGTDAGLLKLMASATHDVDAATISPSKATAAGLNMVSLSIVCCLLVYESLFQPLGSQYHADQLKLIDGTSHLHPIPHQSIGKTASKWQSRVKRLQRSQESNKIPKTP